MRKPTYLRYRRLITLTKEIIRLIMMILVVIVMIKSI